MSGNSLAMMPWFPRDFIAATRHMSLAERGAYRELLDYQWEMGALPNDEVRLARLLAITPEEFAPIWLTIRSKFEPSDTGLANKRLEEHRKKAVDGREKKIAAAAKTNAKRYGERDEIESHSDTHSASPPTPSPSPSPTLKKEEKPPNPLKGEVAVVFTHWQVTHGHQDAKLTPKRKRRIIDGLKAYSVEQLCNAIDGYKHSSFHMGANESGKVFDDVELMLRSGEKIEAGLQYFRHPPRPPPKPIELSPIERVRLANGVVKNDERVVSEQRANGSEGMDDPFGDVWRSPNTGLRRIGS